MQYSFHAQRITGTIGEPGRGHIQPPSAKTKGYGADPVLSTALLGGAETI